MLQHNSMPFEETEFIKVEVRPEDEAFSKLTQDVEKVFAHLDLMKPNKHDQQPMKKMVTLTCILCTKPFLMKDQTCSICSIVKERF